MLIELKARNITIRVGPYLKLNIFEQLMVNILCANITVHSSYGGCVSNLVVFLRILFTANKDYNVPFQDIKIALGQWPFCHQLLPMPDILNSNPSSSTFLVRFWPFYFR